jgi:hypothetical protein
MGGVGANKIEWEHKSGCLDSLLHWLYHFPEAVRRIEYLKADDLPRLVKLNIHPRSQLHGFLLLSSLAKIEDILLSS